MSEMSRISDGVNVFDIKDAKSRRRLDVVESKLETLENTQADTRLSIAEEKLDTVQPGANHYVHPTYTSFTSGFYKIATDSQGHVNRVVGVLKDDITALGIPGENTWRGIQDNLTSRSTTDSLSANQGYQLANGSARDSSKLPLTGGTLTGDLTTVNLYPNNGTGSIGKSTNRYPNLYVKAIDANSLTLESSDGGAGAIAASKGLVINTFTKDLTVGGGVIPQSANQYLLGSASYGWKAVCAVEGKFNDLTTHSRGYITLNSDIYPNNGNRSLGTGLGAFTNIYSWRFLPPKSSDGSTLVTNVGSSDTPFYNIYATKGFFVEGNIDKLGSNSGGVIRLQKSLYPREDNILVNLGGPSKAFNFVYANFLYPTDSSVYPENSSIGDDVTPYSGGHFQTVHAHSMLTGHVDTKKLNYQGSYLNELVVTTPIRLATQAYNFMNSLPLSLNTTTDDLLVTKRYVYDHVAREEKGTWSINLYTIYNSSAEAVVFSGDYSSAGYYYKVGRLVVLYLYVKCTSMSFSKGSTLSFGGMPYIPSEVAMQFHGTGGSPGYFIDSNDLYLINNRLYVRLGTTYSTGQAITGTVVYTTGSVTSGL